MNYFIFILLFFINLLLSVSAFVLPERRIAILILLFFFIILFFTYSYFVFFKILYACFYDYSKNKIKQFLNIICYLIFIFVFIFVFIKFPIINNFQRDSFDDKLIKLFQKLPKGFSFYYIKDEKAEILKNYLNQIDIDVIDSVFQTSEYNELCSRVKKNLKKGSFIIFYNNKFNILSKVTYNSVVLSVSSLLNVQRKICVYGDSVKSIYNFNEDGLGIFSSIIEDSGFIVVEKNLEACDLNLIFVSKNVKINKLKNLIFISKNFNFLGVKSKKMIEQTHRTKVDFDFYAQDLITEFEGVFAKIEDEVIAGSSYELQADDATALAYIESDKKYPVILEKDGNLFISAENILSNLYMQNIGNQNFARYLIYSRFSDYKDVLNNLKPEYEDNFFISYRFLKFIKIILFIISPLFIALFGIIVLGFRKYGSNS